MDLPTTPFSQTIGMGGNQSNQNNQNQEGNSQAESAELYKHALTGNLTEVEKLLKTASQVVVNGQENENKDTALMVATRNGHGAVVAALLKVKGIDINVKNARHWNALMIAAANGDNDTVLEFRPHQALIDLNATDEDGNTALMLAVEKDNPMTVNALLSFSGVFISKLNKVDNSALVLAATGGFFKSVKEMVSHRVYRDLIQPEDLRNAVMAAASNDRPLSIGEMLTQFPNIPVNEGNEEGKTALILACGRNCAEAARRLIRHAATDVNKVDQNSYSALMYACANGFLDPVIALLRVDQLKINAVNVDGYTALMIATQAGYTQIVYALLEDHRTDVYITKDRCRAAHLAKSDNMRAILLEHENNGIKRAASYHSVQASTTPRQGTGESPPDIDDLDTGGTAQAAPLAVQPPVLQSNVPTVPLVNPEPDPAPLLPVVPAQFIVFLDKKDIVIGSIPGVKSKKQIAEKAIYGLQVHPSKGFDRSIYSCHGGGNFQTGVVYQREFKCGPNGQYKYRAQADYAEYAKDLKYQEFRDIVSALGAKSINLSEDTQGGSKHNASVRVTGLFANADGRGGRREDSSRKVETSIEFSRPPAYQLVTTSTVKLADYEYRDEWKYIVEGRLRPGPVKKIVQNIRFESDVAANLLVSLKVKEVGLEVGGDYERTKGFTKSYEVHFFCPEDFTPPSSPTSRSAPPT